MIVSHLHAIRARWSTLVAFALIGVIVGVGVVFLSPPEYRSTSTLYVASVGSADATNAYQGSLLSQERVKSYREILASDRVAEQVATRVGGGATADTLKSAVSVTNQPETTLLLVTATDGSPQRAALIATTYGDVLADVVSGMERTANSGDPATGTPVVSVRTALPAQPDLTPVSPQPVLDIALGLVVGLLVGAGVAVARAAMDTTIGTAAALAELAGVPDIGQVEHDPQAGTSPLAVRERPSSSASEAYRKLRSNLRFVTVDREDGAAVVMITSAVPGEGKSTTAANVALSLADLGNRVLLLEADLRRPVLAETFGLEPAVGLTTVLATGAPLAHAVQRAGRLDVVVAGPVPPNPSELLESKRLAATLDELRARYDWVIVDSAPLLPVTDGAVLSHRCDGVVLLARHGATSSGAVRQAVATLTTAGANLLGTVITQVPRSGGEGYGYGRYGSYASHRSGGSGSGTGTGGSRRPTPLPAPAPAPVRTPAPAPVPVRVVPTPVGASATTTDPAVSARRAGGAHRKESRAWRTRANDVLSAVPDAITPPRAVETS
ncbi:capsular exopolysaccharide synthesis family protein [Actinomycetospora succinea]|uniref:non-specific protein-tyrosine kinase n=1 Tax=Actinomycetospora succinea TaxID=663603 RepID=A0A4R6VCB3_9PSEU|nr:polysaccharide biosynthesis tyrosine autokinase [Actinomycetospora succinea]TDQ58314.1 capsular exopolysaccharide synthesis family protein [Actinomycetospora succinea]